MGLDIYLYWHKDIKATEEREEKFKERSEEIFHEIDKRKIRGRDESWSDEEYAEEKKRYAELAIALGMQAINDPENDLYVGDDLPCNKKKIELRSVRHPKEGLFKIGYFRSSYNPGGINTVVPRAISGNGLYDIFSYNEDDNAYCFQPNWGKALGLAMTMRDQYLAHLKRSKKIQGLFVSKKINNDSYVVALDIVVETCEWVLAQKDPQNYYLHWSG